MRLTSISLFANSVEVASFALRKESSKSRYMARQIIGLDADELTPKFYGFGTQNGEKFYDFGMKPRELVIRLVLNPTFALNEEYNDVRDELYKAISATRGGKIELRFYAGGASIAKLEGFIVKLEAGFFNKTPEVQLTIRCDDPVFRGINPIRLETSEIPLQNPLLLADNQSTAPHGFAGQVTITAPSPSFTIQDQPTNPNWKLNIVPNGGFLVGDVLTFSSDYNVKNLYLTRSGAQIHLIDKIESGSVWPVIFPGRNELFFVNLGGFTWNFIEYHVAYWGV